MSLLKKENLDRLGLDSQLVEAVQNRVENGQYKDAISTAFIFLTEFMRAKSGETSGDGAALIGKCLGGTAPLIRLNELQTTSQTDEQKGIEQVIRGLYLGIRNPRGHENIEDTEDFCVRILIVVDTMLQFLKREVANFDMASFINRIFDPFFVENQEYANSLVNQIPADKSLNVFTEVFTRRKESTPGKTKYTFLALYNRLSPEELQIAVQKIGDVLKLESNLSEISEIFQIMRSDLWLHLQNDVQLRMEYMILEDCRNGEFNASFLGVLQGGGFGIWAKYFGRHFTDKNRLSEILLNLLRGSWNTQNYVGNYFMNALPVIVDIGWVNKIATALAYATISNDAKILKIKLKEVCHNYPPNWKTELAIAFQSQSFGSGAYIEEVMPLLEK